MDRLSLSVARYVLQRFLRDPVETYTDSLGQAIRLSIGWWKPSPRGPVTSAKPRALRATGLRRSAPRSSSIEGRNKRAISAGPHSRSYRRAAGIEFRSSPTLCIALRNALLEVSGIDEQSVESLSHFVVELP